MGQIVAAVYDRRKILLFTLRRSQTAATTFTMTVFGFVYDRGKKEF